MVYLASDICANGGCKELYPLYFWYLTIGYALLFTGSVLFIGLIVNKKLSTLKSLIVALTIALSLAMIFAPQIFEVYQDQEDKGKARSLSFQLYNPKYIPSWASLRESSVQTYDSGEYVFQQVYHAPDGGFLLSEYSEKDFVGTESECRASNPQWDVLPKDFLNKGQYKCILLSTVNGNPVYTLEEGEDWQNSTNSYTKFVPLHYFMAIGGTRVSIKESEQQSQILSTAQAVNLLTNLSLLPGNIGAPIKNQPVLEPNIANPAMSGQYSGFPSPI